MKVEIKTNKKGVCEYFKLNGKEYGEGIYELNIHIKGGEMPKLIITSAIKDFNLECENAEVEIKKDKKED